MSQRRKRAYVVVLAILLACSPVCAHGPQKGKLEGTVHDPQDVPVPNAHVALHWNYTGEPMCWNDGHCKKAEKPHKKVLEIITNDDGVFSAELSPGIWDVFVYRDGFVPACTQIFVETGKTTTLKLRFPGLAPQSQE